MARVDNGPKVAQLVKIMINGCYVNVFKDASLQQDQDAHRPDLCRVELGADRGIPYSI